MKGFSLIELMVTIAIVAILSTIGITSYAHYTTQARFTEIVHAATTYQKDVVHCYHKTSDIRQCNSGQNGITNSSGSNQGTIRRVRVNRGIITIIPNNGIGISRQDRLVYRPTITSSGAITWRATGRAVSKGYITQ